MKFRAKFNDVKFVIGDLHFGEETLFELVYSDTFASKEDYINRVIKNYNRLVTEDAVVVFLGDLGRKDAVKQYIPLLNGYKILILGNHDTYAKAFYTELFDEVYDHPLFVRNRIVLSHEPIPVEPGVINVHGHTHHVFLASNAHFNYCIEHTLYQPVRFKNIINLLSNLPKPNRKFLSEWYKNEQVWQGPPRSDLVLDANNIIDVPETKAIKEIKKKP